MKRWQSWALLAVYVLLPVLAYAAGSGMPWDGPIQTVVDSISGDVAVGILTLVVIGFGFALALAANGYILGWGIAIIFGGAIVIAAPTLVTSFFSK